MHFTASLYQQINRKNWSDGLGPESFPDFFRILFFFLIQDCKIVQLDTEKTALTVLLLQNLNLHGWCKYKILPTQQIQNLHFNNTWSISNLTRWYSFFWRRKNYVVLYIDVHRIIQFMIDFQVQRVKLHP